MTRKRTTPMKIASPPTTARMRPPRRSSSVSPGFRIIEALPEEAEDLRRCRLPRDGRAAPPDWLVETASRSSAQPRDDVVWTVRARSPRADQHRSHERLDPRGALHDRLGSSLGSYCRARSSGSVDDSADDFVVERLVSLHPKAATVTRVAMEPRRIQAPRPTRPGQGHGHNPPARRPCPEPLALEAPSCRASAPRPQP